MSSRRARDDFLAYHRRTSPLVPMPPALYAALPRALRTWLLFEWPMYATDWSYVGDQEKKGEEAAAAPGGGVAVPAAPKVR